MIPIVTPEEMAAIDAAAPEPVDVLIGRAGAAVARSARQMLGGTYGRVVNVIAGNGNNGADGRVAGELLAAAGVAVRVFEAASSLESLPPADLVVDAAYGTGFHGDWVAPQVGDVRVLAVDIPSGVDGLTGAAVPGTLPAATTVTFAALKPGHLLGDGKRLAGNVTVADIGLDVSSARAHVVERADVAGWWRPRPADAHKWTRAVRVVAGSPGMTGAASLAAVAAMRAGAGIVWLSTPGDASPRAELVEVVGRPCPADGWGDEVASELKRFGALVIGPGLGLDQTTAADVRTVVAAAPCPVVVDGDGLTALATSPGGAADGVVVASPVDRADAARPRVRTTLRQPGGRRSFRCRPSAGGNDRRSRPAQGADDACRRPRRVHSGHNHGRPASGDGWHRRRPVRRDRRTAQQRDACPRGCRRRRLAAQHGGLAAARRRSRCRRRGGGASQGDRNVGCWTPMRATERQRGSGYQRPAWPGNAMTSSSHESRWAWAEIDLDAIAHNVGQLRIAAAPAEVWAVVKADGYGHGSVEVARAALTAGAGGLCVALASEGVLLRGAGIEAPILVLSEQPPEVAADLVANDLIATVYTADAIDRLAAAVVDGSAATHRVHLKVDTGMHRVGARPDDVAALVALVAGHAPTLTLDGVFTHLAVADEPADPHTDEQLQRLDAVLATLPDAGDLLVHAANSAAALTRPDARRSLVRAGIAVYGISPGSQIDGLAASLRPALALKARVSHVKRLAAGERLSYGLRHTLASPANVVTVPLGYADGVGGGCPEPAPPC